MSGSIVCTQRDGVAELTITNPDQRNALTPEMLVEIRGRLEALAGAGRVRVVLLQGAGGTFSSGFAIDQIPAPEDLPVDDDIELLCRTIEAVPFVVVALIQGVCVGAALDVACACDLRLATADALVGITPARLGLVYSWRGTSRVVRVAGPDAARHLFYSGELVRADSEVGRRVMSQVLPDEGALAVEADRFSETVAANAPLSIAGAKHVFSRLDQLVALDDDAGAEIHRLRQAALGSLDCAEARDAFAARRRPTFSGR
jgi:enoyl-CoA hydratase/carnithine racemase